MPSTQENNFLYENLVIQLDHKQLRIEIYDTPLGQRFLEALKDNLAKNRVLEKTSVGWVGQIPKEIYIT